MSTMPHRFASARVSHFGTTKVLAWGNGLGIRVPLALARKVGLEEGTTVDLLREGGRILIEPLPQALTLEQLLAGLPVTLWSKWTPGRGDIVSIATASTGRRPALVLSPAAYSARTGLVTVCSIEQEARVRPFGVQMPRWAPCARSGPRGPCHVRWTSGPTGCGWCVRRPRG